MILSSASLLAACNLVLGIDDVSSANGPDSGQRISSATAEPRDASSESSDASPSGQAGSDSSDSGARPAGSGHPADASVRDATAPAASPDAAADLDAGEDRDGEDAGLQR
jgi:hypothetical protein